MRSSTFLAVFVGTILLLAACSRNAGSDQQSSLLPPQPQPLTLAPNTIPDTDLAEWWGTTLTVTGGTAPYSWSTSGDVQAVGLQPLPQGNNTILLTGFPMDAPGNYSLTVTVDDAGGQSVSRTWPVVVHPGLAWGVGGTVSSSVAPAINATGDLTFVINDALWQTGTYTIVAAPGAAVSITTGGGAPQTVTFSDALSALSVAGATVQASADGWLSGGNGGIYAATQLSIYLP